MKPDDQRIAIAKHLGEKNPRVLLSGILVASSGETKDGKFFGTHGLPDYLGDLNAMIAAFSKLGRHWEISQVHDGYYCRIEFGPRNQNVIVAGPELLPVMSESFLKTLGLWKEDA